MADQTISELMAVRERIETALCPMVAPPTTTFHGAIEATTKVSAGVVFAGILLGQILSISWTLYASLWAGFVILILWYGVYWHKSAKWEYQRRRLAEELHGIETQILEQFIAEAVRAFPPEYANIVAFSCCLLAYTRFVAARELDDFFNLPTDVESLLVSPYVTVGRSDVQRVVAWVLSQPEVRDAKPTARLNVLKVIQENARNLARYLTGSDIARQEFGDRYRKLARHVIQSPKGFPPAHRNLVKLYLTAVGPASRQETRT